MAYTTTPSTLRAARERDQAVAQAYNVLHVGYVVLPFVAGVDKFLNKLVNWEQYLAPSVATTLHFDPTTFMRTVGVIEIAASLLVLFAPRIGGYVVALWLAGIIVNLTMTPQHFWDIALRDFGLLLGAVALAKLSPRTGSKE